MLKLFGQETIRKRLTMAIDLDWFDRTNGDHLKEVGIAITSFDGDKACDTHYEHLIIRENQKLINRCKTSPLGFIFGDSKSKVVTLATAKEKLKYYFDGAGHQCPVDLVWNNGIDYRMLLLKLNFDLINHNGSIYDTGVMHLKNQRNTTRIRKLEHLCKDLEIQPFQVSAMHNAGNNAAYTLIAYSKLKVGGVFEFPTPQIRRKKPKLPVDSSQ